jgi:serine/threonine protein kinase
MTRGRYVHKQQVLSGARKSFDIWSFGVILFELCSGRTLFSQDISNDELVTFDDITRLCVWRTISDEELSPVLDKSDDDQSDDGHQDEILLDMEEMASVRRHAKDLIRWCLAGSESERPTIAQILLHPFLQGEISVTAEPCRPMHYHAFMSHSQGDASGTCNGLCFEYGKRGLHNWIDMRQEKITLKGMREGVQHSDVFLLILSEQVLCSYYCQQELLCAIEHQKPIQLVIEVDPRFHPFDVDTWEASKGANTRYVSISGGQGKARRSVTVTRDSDHPWQSQRSGEELTAMLCDAIDQNLEKAVVYRRRAFESAAMMKELCNRNSAQLPPWTQQNKLQASLTFDSSTKVLVLHNDETAHAMIADLTEGIDALTTFVNTFAPPPHSLFLAPLSKA